MAVRGMFSPLALILGGDTFFRRTRLDGDTGMHAMPLTPLSGDPRGFQWIPSEKEDDIVN